MTVDAANLNMINWASALRGNRRKGAALLKAMLADPVQRAGVCSDPDALSLIFGYGPDDPLAEAARGVPASAVVCYANSRYGKGYAGIGELAADGEFIVATLPDDPAFETMLLHTERAASALADSNSAAVYANRALFEGSALLVGGMMLSDAAVSSATEGDLLWLFDSARATGVAGNPAVVSGIFDESPRSETLIEFIAGHCEELGDLIASPEFIEGEAGSALFMNRLCKSSALTKIWLDNASAVSEHAGTVKSTLDAAPDSLFNIKNASHWESSVALSVPNYEKVAFTGADGEIEYAVLSSQVSQWRSIVGSDARIDICREIITTSSGEGCSPTVVSRIMNVGHYPSESNNSAKTVNFVAPGGVAWFYKGYTQSNPMSQPASNFTIYGSVKYATYIAV